jgi:hypothetical protein
MSPHSFYYIFYYMAGTLKIKDPSKPDYNRKAPVCNI